MVPVAGVPPGTPFTLQDTAVLVEPVTLGVKVWVLPRRTDDVVGVTVTLTEEGAGVGVGPDGATEVETPPLQPKMHATVARRMRIARAEKRDCAALQELLPAFCERVPMPRRNAGEGPASIDVGGARPQLAGTIAATAVNYSH
jgi:hypothetical protein